MEHLDTIKPQEGIETSTDTVLMIITGGTITSVPHPSGGLSPTKGLVTGFINEMENNSMPMVDVIEWDNTLDSSSITPGHWIRLAKEIKQNYHKYKGFVIVHGTDTMSYSASALSFMLEDLAKPIIFTGALIPLGRLFNDAKNNLSTALFAACHADIPEVLICFANRLLRANRSTKYNNWGQNVFETPNFPILGEFGYFLTINRELVRNPPKHKLKCHTNLFTNISVIWIVPGFDDNIFDAVIHNENNIAIILACYGSGNAPIENSHQTRIFEKIMNSNIPVVVTSQCRKGTINLSLYTVGMKLQNMGFISGKNMTIEACVTKLAYLMGRGIRGKRLKFLMETNIRGELTELTEKDSVTYYQSEMFKGTDMTKSLL